MNERNLSLGQWEDGKKWNLCVGQRRKTFWNRYTYIIHYLYFLFLSMKIRSLIRPKSPLNKIRTKQNTNKATYPFNTTKNNPSSTTQAKRHKQPYIIHRDGYQETQGSVSMYSYVTSQRKWRKVDQTHGICGVVYVPFAVLHVYTAVSNYICLWLLLFS
jgi:hypothetical protein